MASNGTSSRLNQASRSVCDKTEIDKCAHRWRSGDDKDQGFRIWDCPHVLCRGRRFCCRHFMPGVLVSRAARRVTNFIASWLNESHGLTGCVHVHVHVYVVHNGLNDHFQLQLSQLEHKSLSTKITYLTRSERAYSMLFNAFGILAYITYSLTLCGFIHVLPW